jgi:hypothetical protein
MRVFLSHAEHDRAWVSKLADKLRESGLDVWSDASRVEPGANWLLEGGRALQSADAVVIVLSYEASQSPEFQKTIEFALTSPRLKDRVVTIAREEGMPYRFPWILRELPIVENPRSPQAAAEHILRLLPVATSK